MQDFKLQFTASARPRAEDITNFVHVNQCISVSQNESLIKDVTNEEIWNAVNNIGPLKAQGPDGIHAIFYHNCWDIVGDSICNLVKDFFNNNSSLRLMNHTNISLIPKVDNPELVSQFHPISLCNVTYKIITKVLINHLKPILANYISKN